MYVRLWCAWPPPWPLNKYRVRERWLPRPASLTACCAKARGLPAVLPSSYVLSCRVMNAALHFPHTPQAPFASRRSLRPAACPSSSMPALRTTCWPQLATRPAAPPAAPLIPSAKLPRGQTRQKKTIRPRQQRQRSSAREQRQQCRRQRLWWLRHLRSSSSSSSQQARQEPQPAGASMPPTYTHNRCGGFQGGAALPPIS